MLKRMEDKIETCACLPPPHCKGPRCQIGTSQHHHFGAYQLRSSGTTAKQCPQALPQITSIRQPMVSDVKSHTSKDVIPFLVPSTAHPTEQPKLSVSKLVWSWMERGPYNLRYPWFPWSWGVAAFAASKKQMDPYLEAACYYVLPQLPLMLLYWS